MTILTIIAGIIFIVSGTACIMTPVATFISAGYYIAILLIAYGIVGIVNAFKGRAFILEIVLSVLAIIVGGISLVKPGTVLSIDRMLILFIAGWFIVEGIITIVMSLKLKNIKKFWLLSMIMGVLAVLVGIYSVIHPTFAALTGGVLIGVYFIEVGLNMIILGSAARTIKKEMERMESYVEDNTRREY